MIESISIADVATYGTTPVVIDGLSQFNFFFGSNGTGKTTISRVVADEANYSTCSIMWKAGTKLPSLVYNRDFVERNFNQSAELKGVFTLGEEQVDTLTKIAKAKGELDSLTGRIETLTQSLLGVDGEKGKLEELEADFKDKCWEKKNEHIEKLKEAFKGFLNSKESFKEKVLTELISNTATLISLAELEKKAETVFVSNPAEEKLIPSVDISLLLKHETNPILRKRVIGKNDVDIAAMIQKLGNSDWVREGKRYYEVNEGTCPFCQQSTSESFANSLEQYFDETFITDNTTINDLANDYAEEADRIQNQLTEIISAPSRFPELVQEKLKEKVALLYEKIKLNTLRLAEKRKEASQVVELESLRNVFEDINILINSVNARVTAHNEMIANLASEKETLTEQVWRFVLEKLEADIADYKKRKEDIESAISELETKINDTKNEKYEKEAVIRELEKQTTSIQPTIDGINGLLSSFGFLSFKLAKAESGSSYKLVRSDGSDAKETLSEGEKSFVTFLYFYHLLKGGDLESGITTDRIVVFDDPVSSLDSDILFIVSRLIKELFDEVRKGIGQIKQIFVMTHNVYFHKEVTYKSSSTNGASFWIVRKTGLVSTVKKYLQNPIKTSYELLWTEVRKPDRSNLTIQNTLRRILEYYFKILGGTTLDKINEKFEGKDMLLCNSLISWVHDGSHNPLDDLYVSIDDSTVNSYLRVFKDIFDKSGHISHYEMMMGERID